MNISPIQPKIAPAKIDTSHIPLESLASNKALTEDQKVAEDSKQF